MNDCMICFESLPEVGVVKCSQCRQIFHYGCINRVIECAGDINIANCPHCRDEVIKFVATVDILLVEDCNIRHELKDVKAENERLKEELKCKEDYYNNFIHISNKYVELKNQIKQHFERQIIFLNM